MFNEGDHVKVTLPIGTIVIGKLVKSNYDPYTLCINFSNASRDNMSVLYHGVPMYASKVEKVMIDEPENYGSTLSLIDNLGRAVRFVKWIADDSKQWVSDKGARFSWTMLTELIADGTYTLVDHHVA